MKSQKPIKPLVVRTVGTFYLSVMAGRSRFIELVKNFLFLTKLPERVLAPVFNFLRERKFRTIIRLDNLRLISKIDDCPLNTIHRIICGLLLIGINEPFARSFVYHGILIKLHIVNDRTCRALSRNVLHVELPFHADLFRRIIGLGLIRLPFPNILIKPIAPQISVKRSGVARIGIIQPQFSVQLV